MKSIKKFLAIAALVLAASTASAPSAVAGPLTPTPTPPGPTCGWDVVIDYGYFPGVGYIPVNWHFVPYTC